VGSYAGPRAPSRDGRPDLSDLCPSLVVAVANEPADEAAVSAGKKRL
jgi:hypothetical protein